VLATNEPVSIETARTKVAARVLVTNEPVNKELDLIIVQTLEAATLLPVKMVAENEYK